MFSLPYKISVQSLIKSLFKAFECAFRAFECRFKAFEQTFPNYGTEI